MGAEPGLNNQLVRRFFATFDSDTAGFRQILHPRVEWFPVEENRSPTRGIDGAMRYREQWLETWDDHQFTVEEVVEGERDVVARIHISGRGKASGAAVDLRFYAQFQIEDDRIIRIYDHDDRKSALAAAGLDS